MLLLVGNSIAIHTWIIVIALARIQQEYPVEMCGIGGSRGDHAESRIRSACFAAINNAGRAPPLRATLFLLVPAGVLGRRYPS
ncbi:hypothetical protein ALC56_12938 [Trachymyrmex septentrionalis]|uniref:Uncharacterized protein n=1 Tax=Trachymyrmex septentrionalis TaxID=34720 RepID=A0A151JU08_9HYME|nr:hypothetical protein ALC56_12938 [Trachymyrmex septentrionalis]